MKVQFKYAGSSGIVSALGSSRVAFATNMLREASYFGGDLGRPLVVREGLAALHSVVVSDFKYRPKDRLEFQAWLEEQDRKFLQSLALKSDELRTKLEAKEARLEELRDLRRARMKPFFDARKQYFEYVYTNQYELDYLLDPVVTVHPDELAFEAFSRDESSYGRLAVKYDLFKKIDAFECGTTNVDFSSRLYKHLNRMRSYRDTRFDVDPSGFTVTSSTDGAHKEKKIDLPDSWVKGFLQVQSIMAMGLTHLRLAPIDLFNIIRWVRRFKAKASPRALRWELEPGKPAKVVFEPWEVAITLSPTAVYTGPKRQTIRTWGRRRLTILSRLVGATEGVDVYLAGHGLPTLWVCDLGDATFTLGLSGWTDNDWTGESRFGLLNRKVDVTGDQLAATYAALRQPRYATPQQLAETSGLSVDACKGALSFLCQAGRAMYDLKGGVYRHRDLFHTPFDAKKEIAKLKAAAEDSDPKAKEARKIFEMGHARLIARRPVTTGFKLSGSVRGSEGRVRPQLSVDHEGSIVKATCTCTFFKKFKLTKGPCECMLALRLAHMKRLEDEGVV
ncbi:MAG: SWIM zinc finger family protein [Myxococcota bacterium]